MAVDKDCNSTKLAGIDATTIQSALATIITPVGSEPARYAAVQNNVSSPGLLHGRLNCNAFAICSGHAWGLFVSAIVYKAPSLFRSRTKQRVERHRPRQSAHRCTNWLRCFDIRLFVTAILSAGLIRDFFRESLTPDVKAERALLAALFFIA